MRLIAIIIVGALVSGCVIEKKMRAFPDVSRLESEIHRGTSTKVDVQRALGTPSGFGGAILPTDPNLQEIWLYQDIEATDFKSQGTGIVCGEIRQRVLLVFFQQGVFDGFMWYSNAGAVSCL